ncbi:hypothetical protein HMPREF9996_00328 [Aggregatibacter actinomycetemcomitans Y4]|nr:hypothetical protein HMPREF9996_00328 [Aggregatibacter actinomycetemcomitans Y4]
MLTIFKQVNYFFPNGAINGQTQRNLDKIWWRRSKPLLTHQPAGFVQGNTLKCGRFTRYF